MTGKTFLNSVANGETDIISILLSLLEETGSEYCVIGGLGVNAYAEPVVSLDLDLVVVSDHISDVRSAAESKGRGIGVRPTLSTTVIESNPFLMANEAWRPPATAD